MIRVGLFEGIPYRLLLCYAAAMHKIHGNRHKHATLRVNEMSAQLRVQSMLLQLPIHNGPAKMASLTNSIALMRMLLPVRTDALPHKVHKV